MGTTLEWPKAVAVRGRVGEGLFFNQRSDGYSNPNSPCCAVGQACHAFYGKDGDKKTSSGTWDERMQAWNKAYHQVHATYFGRKKVDPVSIVSLNDEIESGAVRALLYNASMCRLGYRRGQNPKVKELADRTAAQFGEFKFKK